MVIQNAELDENVTKRWRWNLGGLAYQARPSASDDWDSYPPTVAATMDGGFVADFITTGSLNCDRLNGGTINGQTIYGGTITGAAITSNYGVHYTQIAGGLLTVQCSGNGENYPTMIENGWTLKIGGQNVSLENQSQAYFKQFTWQSIFDYLAGHIN